MVLTAGSVQLAGTGLSEEQMNLIDELHSESQAALTQRSENANQIIVEDSGHYIHVEQPSLVTDAIHVGRDRPRRNRLGLRPAWRAVPYSSIKAARNSPNADQVDTPLIQLIVK
jgi:hypothetical protein